MPRRSLACRFIGSDVGRAAEAGGCAYRISRSSFQGWQSRNGAGRAAAGDAGTSFTMRWSTGRERGVALIGWGCALLIRCVLGELVKWQHNVARVESVAQFSPRLLRITTAGAAVCRNLQDSHRRDLRRRYGLLEMPRYRRRVSRCGVVGATGRSMGPAGLGISRRTCPARCCAGLGRCRCAPPRRRW